MPKKTTEAGKELALLETGEIERNLSQAEHRVALRKWRRDMAAPLLASGGTWLTGEGAHLAELAAHQPLVVAASTAATAACATCLARWRLGRVWSPRWSGRFWTAGSTAATWTALASIVGPHWTPGWFLTGSLAAATVGLSGRWWREHRVHVTPTRPALTGAEQQHTELAIPTESGLAENDDAPEDQVTVGSRIQERWETYFAAKGKKFKGSILTGETELATGWQFEVLLDPENNDFGDLLPARPRIAAVMGLSTADVLIERHPSGSEDRALISFLLVNPLKDGIAYQGPRYNHGFIDVGMFADGTGWGSVQLTDHENSVLNGLVSGDPGSGKSVFLENLGMSALHSLRWKVFYCDGSEDADSSVLLNDHMTWSTAGLEGAKQQLKAIQKYMRARGMETRSIGGEVRGVNPSSERMAILWIIDEFHRLAKADPDFAREVENVVRLGRKKGVAVWVATQGLGLEDFAGIATLRDILTSRNVVAFYSSSTYAHNLISGVSIAPNTLPTGGGYAYLSRPGMPTRAAMLRTDYAKDMTPWARELQDVPWDDLGLLAVKKIMNENRVSPEEAQEIAIADLTRYKKALQIELMIEDGDEPKQEIAEVKPLFGFADLRAKISSLGAVPAASSDSPVGDAPAKSKKETILAVLRERGGATTGDIARATGFDLPLVSTTLARAAQKGEVRNQGHGKWSAVDSDEDVA